MTIVISIDRPKLQNRTRQVKRIGQEAPVRRLRPDPLEPLWTPVSDLSILMRPATEEIPDELDVLLEEYHALVDLELADRLTPADTARLRYVEAELDELDAHDPIERTIDERMRTVSDELDAILGDIQRHLPSP